MPGKTYEVTKRQGKQARNHDLRKGVFLFRKQMYESRAHSRLGGVHHFVRLPQLGKAGF